MYTEVNEAADVNKEKLVADFKVVVADAEALLRATASDAGEKVGRFSIAIAEIRDVAASASEWNEPGFEFSVHSTRNLNPA